MSEVRAQDLSIRAWPSPAIGYRPEIDGLRAVAVLAVVLFHIGLVFPGGYVGVDIFFVISGYLITGLLVAELEATGTIRLLDFYRRRIRRLLPALTVMLLTVAAIGLVVLSPFGELQKLAKTLTATALNVSNFFFMQRLGYFEPTSEQNPLLHTWTLAVEEQFYLVWPLGLILLARGGGALRVRLAVGLAVLTAVSFAGALWATTNQPLVAFFSMPTRAWEFGVGGLLVLVRTSAFRTVSVVAGAVLIGCALMVLDDETPFPGAAALLPVLGAALLIHGAANGGLAARVLASPPLVTIGRLSYSWYLWHWPLIVYGRLLAPEAGVARDAFAAALALGAAWLSWRYVEEPLRRRKGPAIRLGLAAAGVVVAMSGVIAAAVFLAPRLSPGIAALDRGARDGPPEAVRCYSDTDPSLKPAADCVLAGDVPRLLLWGDSHADHLTPMLAEARTPILVRTFGACPPTAQGYPWRQGKPYRACARFNAAVAEELDRHPTVRGVILAADWTRYTGENWVGPPYEQALRMRVAELRARGLKVVLVAPGPHLPERAPACLYRRSEAACSISRAEAERDRAQEMAVLRRVAAAYEEVRIWDPLPALCDGDLCRPRRGALLYTDQNHLSATGARSLKPSAAPYLAWAAR